MALPPEHTALLQRAGFPVPRRADLTADERTLLDKYGYWLQALARGNLAPVTPVQEHFVLAAHGEAQPSTPYEVAWAKYRAAEETTPDVGPLEAADRLGRLEAARADEADVRGDYESRKAAIMAKVRPELEALEAEFADRLKLAADETARAEAEARAAVLAHGASVKHGSIYAMWSRGRVTWDGKGLARYAESHPEVAEFRKVGQPTVSLRAATTKAQDAEEDGGQA